MSDPRELLRGTFDSAAETYERVRPSYPVALFDDLVELAELRPGDHLLEIGCATGKATLPLLRRGFRVVCVELGPSLTAIARRNFDGLPAEVHNAAFEEWAGEAGGFALVYAATAWAWIDPEVRYRKAHRLLRPGGHLAFWSAMHAFPLGFDPFFTEMQGVYEAIGEGSRGAWPPLPPEDMPDARADIERSGLFEDVQVRRYVWDVVYDAEEYVSLLNTFSDHIAMAEANRQRLYEEIRRRLDNRPDPRVRRHWYAILHVARAVSDREPS
jgi:SAM-dependent methyltransferase